MNSLESQALNRLGIAETPVNPDPPTSSLTGSTAELIEHLSEQRRVIDRVFQMITTTFDGPSPIDDEVTSPAPESGISARLTQIESLALNNTERLRQLHSYFCERL